MDEGSGGIDQMHHALSVDSVNAMLNAFVHALLRKEMDS
jgi:hypothetical protein